MITQTLETKPGGSQIEAAMGPEGSKMGPTQGSLAALGGQGRLLSDFGCHLGVPKSSKSELKFD